MRHRIAHLFGWTKGFVVSIQSDGVSYIGFKCCDCDIMTGIHRSRLAEAPRKNNVVPFRPPQDAS